MLDLVEKLFKHGVEFHKSGKVEVASQLYTAVLKAHPKHPDANHNMGVLAVDIGKVQEALPFFETALEANADTAQFWLSYIDALINVERIADAQAVFDQAKNNGAQGDGFDQLEQRLNVPDQGQLETSTAASESHQDQPNILDSLKLDQALRLSKKKAKEGSAEEAQLIYQDILVKFPKNKRAIDGIKALAGGPVGKAFKVQDPPQYQLQSLIDLYSQGLLQKALEQATVLLRQFPSSSVLYNICGAVYKELGQFDASVEAYSRALTIKPDYADAYYNMGIILKKQGKLEEAIEAYNKALAIKPDNADAYYNMGIILKEQGKLEEAIEAYNKALAIKPDYAEAYCNMGLTLQEQGKLEEAIEAYNKVLVIKPDYADAHSNIGNTLKEQGKLEEAIEAYNKVLVIKPDYADAYSNIGNTLKEQGKLEEAIEAYNKVLVIKPDDADAYYNMGIILREQGKLEEAIEAYNKALAIKPDYADAYNNMGVTLKEQGKLEEAIEAYNKALAIKPDYADAYSNMGIALADQGKLEEAIEAYNKTLAIKPDYAEAYNNMGIALADQGKLEEAIEAYNKALAIKPDYIEAYNNIGVAFKDQGKLEEAIEAYNKTLAIKPDYAEAYNNMGIALADQGKLEEAMAAYNKALAIKPDYESARAVKLHRQAHICDWDNIATDIKLIPKLGTFETHVPPFMLLSLEDAPESHRLRSEIYSKARYPQKHLPLPAKPLTKPKRIRIGYFSTDFKEHPVAYLIAKVLEQHNRDQFEVFGYSLYGSSSGEMRQRLEKSFDSFTDVQSMSDRDIALQAQQDGIDIAVDLTGYTANSRSGILAFRAAPVQVNYLGYPGSMGAEFIDYIVADQHLIPPENQKHFSEKQIYLPDVYLPTDNTLPFSNEPSSRFNLGLPDSGFVFCAINNSYKVNERVFDIWMRLLKSVDGSVLWLLETNEIVKANLEKEANKRGVTSDRLVFAKKVSHEKYLSQFHQADLFLDTFPYTAGATASNALWAGLPIVTKNGQSYTARMAGSMLNAIGLPELITQTEKDYEALILDLATNPEKLTKIKEKLDANRLTHPLFNTELYTKHLENGYQQAYQNYFEGNLPKTITVLPLNARPSTSTSTSRRITQAVPRPASIPHGLKLKYSPI